MKPIITQPIRAVIFDLDGTLIDTAAEIAVAVNHTLRELGLRELAKKDVENLIGRGVHSMIERALAQVGARGVDVEAAVARFEGHYERTVGTSAELYPGVREGVELLRDRGYALSVVTNKPRFFTEKLLERLGVRDHFAGVVCGDDGLPRKPRREMLDAACRAMASANEASLMIGDSDNDIVAARNAGCPVWCVPYGYNEGRGPETLACDQLVPTVAEAARLIVDGNR